MYIVTPSIRPERLETFLKRWQFEKHQRIEGVIIVEDNPEKTFEIPDDPKFHHYAHADIDADLGGDAWIIPRRTDCVRSYGFLKAAQMGARTIWTLDDDCYPLGPQSHSLPVIGEPVESPAWKSTLKGAFPRGFPYRESDRAWNLMLHIGLWKNSPDFDAPTKLVDMRQPIRWEPRNKVIPPGKYVPMCGMNLFFDIQLLPAMYFLTVGPEYPYDRSGDIWAGIFAKRICDHKRWAVACGDPLVEHHCASDPFVNIVKEAAGLRVNEWLWQIVDNLELTGSNVGNLYMQISNAIASGFRDDDYFMRLRDAMKTWVGLCPSMS
ncbi:MAG: hypothetical protein ACYSYL_00295 [Planctomycetota bacterium]|jgi:hypothetical protein